MGTSLSLKGKVIAVTGASGTMGRSLIAELSQQGAKIVALTTSPDVSFAEAADRNIEVVMWKLGAEAELRDRLQGIDILVLNHGVNVLGDRTPEAIQKSFEVNTFSVWRWMELFLTAADSSKSDSKQVDVKEVWVNTSEAEVNPAFSPLYELSKRAIGEIITLRRLDAPCIIRKLVLGPFKSELNPYGVMSPSWVAWAIVALAKVGCRDIIVTVNPLTYLSYPLAEFWRSLYFRLFSKGKS
ncbi:bifunctional sterol desaturase/short chain dehydrogenase [Tumidithrix elongata RA019]|uniref:Bifunctional sterol desaturase/short chain dehydrogenase n=1 Tax=Tumidithrix elongata BACA0141 TaxID=2716417 RepID=A0AAW9PWJ9_9CYAN|nr:bifunctional sterol desaturase/short chain dehydrogenase [Tumidithrix elongata RA019]